MIMGKCVVKSLHTLIQIGQATHETRTSSSAGIVMVGGHMRKRCTRKQIYSHEALRRNCLQHL